MNKLNIKKQIFLLTSLIMAIAFASILSYSYYEHKSKITSLKKFHYQKIKKSFQKNIIHHYKKPYSKIVKNFLNDKAIATIVEKDRFTFYNLMAFKYEQITEKDPHIQQLHIHLKDGETFFRLHDIDAYGDNIAELRPMARLVHQQQKPIFGFETGKSGVSYRIFEPIFVEDNYIGAIEIGISIRKLLEIVTYFNNIDAMIYIDKNEFKMDSNPIIYESIKDNSIIKKLPPLEDIKKSLLITHKEKEILVNSFEIINFSDKSIGKFIFFLDLTEEYEGLYKELILIVTIFLLSFALLLTFMNILLNKVIKRFDEANQELQTIFNTSKDGIAILDLETKFIFANKSYLQMTGYTLKELRTKKCSEMSIPEDKLRAKTAIEEVLQKGYIQNFEKTCIAKDKKRFHVNMSITLMPDKKRLLVATKNITEQKKQQEQIKEYVELIDENIITSSADLKGNITYVSNAFCHISGYTREELLGQNHRLIKHPDNPIEIFEKMWDTITDNKIWRGELKNKKKDGSFYWVDSTIYPIFNEYNEKVGYTAIRKDITDKKMVEKLAITDKLTQIYNRIHLDRCINEEFQRAKRYPQNTTFSLILLDIDKFKTVNDTFGHQVGDTLLQEFSKVLQKNIRQTDTLGRWGGEEFLIICPNTNLQGAFSLAEKLREAINLFDFSVVGNKTASFGVSFYKDDDTEESLLSRADKALYTAKDKGRNRVEHL